ncbi:outer membrane lipid asymmetry maintenance protein MlaD [Ferruginivarius sediminum]|uniref:Outer membrane lipid asymmetry maintenance protein MlaD n=1 Tax=Ferruginivarius sediminum TaxID=2661937 RepID=A0A369TCK9_9PROT|nr:outer membrane lipid asymmetry maintenance protein MlaD [Ferruginivarius sediminum]RDD63020.1 outer membrane lipid asymmetry maintenance protein MlaD [Ferruginivarius sediminum]
MRRNAIETIMGAAVLLVAAVFVVFAFSMTGVATVSGYRVHARFDNAAGLSPGTDVRMSGVKIGSVVEQKLDSKTYFADVTMTIDDQIKLPQDTSARIVPEGLLGGNYVMLEPGGMEEMIESGGTIQYTQGAINIVDMVGRLIFSGDQGAADSGGQAGGGAFPQ